MNTSPNTVYIPPISQLQPPPLKTKKQLRIEITLKHFANVIRTYKQKRASQQERRNKFRKYWIYMKIAKGDKITNNDQSIWKQVRSRLTHLACCELSAQLNETRKWLKLRESGCARRLNFYPGARKLNF